MATNSRILRCFFLTVFFILVLLPVYAQSAGYFIETEGGEQRFIQRLVWSGGEYALRYEVVIESGAGGTFREYHREFTTALYIDISLQPGSYRFHVITYDILNRPGNASEWKYIEVLPALKPEPVSVLPEYVTGADGEGPYGFIINLTGYNLEPEAEVFIRLADGTRIAAETIDSGDGDDMKVFFESDRLIPDEYEIVIRNPGGLEASIGGVPLLLPKPEPTYMSEDIGKGEKETPTAFKPLKPFIFSVGLAFMPSFPVYGDSVKDGVSLYGFTVRANALFRIPFGIYIGPELSVFASLANHLYNYDEWFTFSVGGNLLVRKWFLNERAALSFRAGADYGIVPDWIEQVNIKMDISFLWRFTNHLLLEGGLEYSHLLAEFTGGFFRPWLGISCQF